jgi:hypothetical protein
MTEDEQKEAVMARVMKLIGHRFKPIEGGASVFIYRPGNAHDESMCAILSRLGTVVFLPDNERGDYTS